VELQNTGQPTSRFQKVFHFLTLFASSSTLICCALPALLVALGAGSVMASLVSHVPGFIWLSTHKLYVFLFATVMLALSGYGQWHSRKTACPIDPNQRDACQSGKKWSLYIYFFSLACYLVGGFFAFIAPRILFA
jgi:hypothetical protein